MSLHSQSFGRPIRDVGASHISADHINTHFVNSVQQIDKNVVEIERDIFDLQDIALQNAEESMTTLHEVANLQNDIVELRYVQSLPWFAKTQTQYGQINQDMWNDHSIPNNDDDTFVRFVDLNDTYSCLILILPRSSAVGEARHASLFPKSNEACVYVSTQPQDAVRLSSFDVEWSENNTFVGHSALLAKPSRLSGTLFGASATPSGPGECVVFPSAGPFLIRSIHIDNNQGHSRIVFTFKKFQSSDDGASLGSFVYYGLQ